MSINKAKAANGTPDQQRELLVASQRKAQQAWQRLWMRIQSITPSGLLRFLLMVIALAGLIWLIASTFQSLAAFVIGIMLAYITLPVVNWLNRFLPRGLAVLLVILGEIALVALFFALLIPAVIQQLLRFLQTLPTTDQLRASFTQLAQQTQSWPQPVRVFLRGWLQQSTVNLQHNFTQYILGLVSLGARSILGLLSAFSFVLSLLVIPTWMFALLNDQRKGVRAVDRLLPDWLRPDFWAVARILDRTFRVYFRELVVMAIAVGLLTYLGLLLLARLGVQGIPFPILLAVLAGFTDFIPSIGTLLGTIVAVLFGLTSSWQTALAILLLYVAIHFLRNWLLSPMLTGGSVKIHPVILLVILVIASQFGLIWLFLGAPLAQIVFDLYRYVYGRLSDPPRPAGILPGESVPTTREPRGTNRRTMVPFSERTTFQGNTPLPPEKVS
ncbi:MAG: AI-2E family transporter [Chloroflexi bacterium]|nr:MAG: AI-2E family transporter [Chloroflexota bacterium]TME64020.1 MAG: AI-2E family transporter [Chloroflexota bacterium]